MRAFIGASGLVVALLCACGSEIGDDGTTLPPRGDDGAGAETKQDTSPQEPIIGPEEEVAPPAEPDGDGDGIPDSMDCEPENKDVAGIRLLDETLSTDAQKFAPVDGFPAESWTYAEEAYRQVRLVDEADASLFTLDKEIGDVDLEVRAAPGEYSNALTPLSARLRQVLVLVGARVEGETFSAYGCGPEVVGTSPDRVTSIVKLTGAPGKAIATTVIKRTPRMTLQANEPYSMRAQVKGGKLTCTVAQGEGGDAITTVEADGITDLKGSLGFFTRQTKAAFFNAKACKLNVAPPKPK